MIKVQKDRFAEDYQEVIERVTGVVEDRAHYRSVPIRERVLCGIWHGQYLAKDALKTQDGESVVVQTPGWWNVEGGPDFLKAEFSFGDGNIERGDVEVHLYASGWYQHQHHKNSEYNRVKLHVVLWNDREDDFVVNQAGQPIRQLVIEDNLEQKLGDLIDRLRQEDFPKPLAPNAGLCQQYLMEGKVTKKWIGDFLDKAGSERILTKARAFSQRSNVAGDEQTFYENFMISLGYKKNKAPFETLAKRVPLSHLQKIAENGAKGIQAILFHVSGLMPLEPTLPGMPDPETYELMKDYQSTIREFHLEIKTSRMDRDDWNLAGTRPTNSPIRRIAAASHFLASNLSLGLINSLVNCLRPFLESHFEDMQPKVLRQIRKEFEQVFAPQVDGYWGLHYSFGGKPCIKPMQLIGAERMEGILFNVVLPALLLKARKEADSDLEALLFKLYDRFPPLTETSVTRFMTARVFGDDAIASELITSARRQQGLYQLYNDFESDDRSCEDCAFARAMVMK